MTREKIVTALRCCGRNDCDGCPFCNDDSSCISKMADNAADLIESQQREIEALRQANEGLRYPMIYTPEEIDKLQGDLIQRNAELLRVREELKEIYSRIDQLGNCAEVQGGDNDEQLAGRMDL